MFTARQNSPPPSNFFPAHSTFFVLTTTIGIQESFLLISTRPIMKTTWKDVSLSLLLHVSTWTASRGDGNILIANFSPLD